MFKDSQFRFANTEVDFYFTSNTNLSVLVHMIDTPHETSVSMETEVFGGLRLHSNWTEIYIWNNEVWRKYVVLTNAAVLSSVAINTITSVIVHGIDTSCSILTGLNSTIVNICEKLKKKEMKKNREN